MLKEILKEHLEKTNGCLVSVWLSEFSEDDQNLFKQLANKERVNLTRVYEDLSLSISLPFKLTSFKQHLRGACTCPKN